MKCERVQICKFNKQNSYTNFLAKNGKQKIKTENEKIKLDYNLIKMEITKLG